MFAEIHWQVHLGLSIISLLCAHMFDQGEMCMYVIYEHGDRVLCTPQ